MIEIKNLTKTFHSSTGDVDALHDINLKIEDGDIFGIIGLSGAGKSTLVRCINLLCEPDSGEVIIDGNDITKLAKKDLLKVRQQIGMIFQGYNLLEQRSLLSNVCFPLEIAGLAKSEAKKRAHEMLKLVGLDDRCDAYPSQLSGGQKQRVAIARALATNPKYLLCDEATSALDPNTTLSILNLIQEINEKLGVTVIIITHQMSVIDQICNKVAVIDNSRIAEAGEVSEIFANPKSDIAKELILPKTSREPHNISGVKLRLVFNGNSAYEPLISSMILECQAPVNILFADTKTIDDKEYGQMLIQLPDDKKMLERICIWLKSKNVEFSKEAGV